MRSREIVRITLVVAATLLGLYLLSRVRSVILLVGIAAFLAVALEPGVTFLQRLVRFRGLAVMMMVILVVLAIGGFVASVVPPITRQAQNLVENLPAYSRQLQDSSTPLGRLEQRFRIRERVESAVEEASSAVTGLGAVFGTVVGAVANLLIVLVLSLYFLINAPRMKREGLRLLPASRRQRGAALVDKIFAKVGGWMQGNILVSVIAGVVSFIALLILGVPYPAALAMWVAITDLIPMVGAMLGALVCVVVAFFTDVTTGVLTLIFFLIYQQVENYLISPRVMKRTLDVSPVAVILAALIGGSLLGPIGVLLAVPAAASIKVAAQELWLSDRTPEAPQQRQRPGEQTPRRSGEAIARKPARTRKR
ncbi:MAG: AI-2E family transporter [Actinomycetota bacterium]